MMRAARRWLFNHPGWLLAAMAIAVHLYASGGYGYFRDELYFIVCGEHPDWGYVDQPPLVPLIAATMHGLFPSSLRMLRLIPALAHAGTIALTAETVRLLGGGRWAEVLAALSVLGAGAYLVFGTLLLTDTLQPLAWLFCAYGLIRVMRGGSERWWFPVGVAAGIGFLAKYTIAFWLVAVAIGIVATPARRMLARPSPYLGAALATLIVLPNLAWQWAHAWPFLEIGRVAAETKNVALSPLAFLGEEMWQLNPATAPVWLAGLVALAFTRRFADLRAFAVAFAVLIGAMIALHGKAYYPMGAYPLLFAAGGVALEAWIARTAARVALTAAIAAFVVVAAPFALPILAVERFVAYERALGIVPNIQEKRALGALPQHFSDMFGWPELAALVGRTYEALPPEEQRAAVFLANNYGEAAAIDVLGAPWHLPPAISPHNQYFLWGPRGHDGSIVLRLAGDPDGLRKTYASVEPAGRFEVPWAMPDETGQTLWICRGRRQPLDEAWESLRRYY
jgi:4-amino-4-deoxy-L-arabinose transferase-like glycosyltransferase